MSVVGDHPVAHVDPAGELVHEPGPVAGEELHDVGQLVRGWVVIVRHAHPERNLVDDARDGLARDPRHRRHRPIDSHEWTLAASG
jgi:hypothetical protein